MNKVEKYYDQSPETEWNRLVSEAQLEFLITMEYLKKYLAPNSLVFDIGGGPGKYAIELTKMGHKVTLLDLSEGNINYAKEKAKENNVQLDNAIPGNAIDLSKFEDSAFDAVINLGPLYHLLDEKEREKTIIESIRVLKNNGLAVFGFMSKYAVVYYQLNHNPENILFMEQTMLRAVNEQIHNVSDEEPGFTDAYYIEPSILSDYMMKYSLKKLAIVGVEGMASQSENKIMNSSLEAKKKWLKFLLATAETNASLNGSEHILYFGKK